MRQLTSIIDECDFFIGSDSALMHLAATTKCKTIGLFGPTNDKLYGHQNSTSFIVRTREDYNYFTKTHINQNKSYMLSIQPNQILDVIIENKLL